MKLLLSFAHNPSLVTAKSILNVHYIYRHSVRNGLVFDQNGILFLQEMFTKDECCVRLQVVPRSICNIIFVALYCNPVSVHMNAFRTYNRIRMCYFGRTFSRHA